MDVVAERKQTDIDDTPVDWEVKSLSEIGSIKTGPFGTLLKASEYAEAGGTPVISVREIREGFLRVDEETPRVPEDVIRRLPEFLLEEGDIVVGRKGSIERSAMIDAEQEGWFLGSDGLRVRPTEDYYPPYISHQLRSQAVKSWLLRHSTGTTMDSLNQEILSRCKIPVPPREEQEAIAEALSDVDALLASIDAAIEKKRNVKTATMQRLLTGEERLPGIEEEWRKKKLGKIGSFSKGKGIRRSDLTEDGVPCVRYGELYTHHQDKVENFVSYAPRKIAEQAERLRTGDILFTGSGETKKEIGMCAAYLKEEEAYAGGDIIILRPDSECSEFLGYVLNAPDAVRQKASKAQGDAVVHIRPRDLAEVEISLPPPEEQCAIAEILSDMDSEIEAWEKRRAKTEAVKTGMMQELLTGETRLV